MRNAAFAALSCILCFPPAALAEGRELLGYGRLFSNDFFGDGHDRWRSGGYAISRVQGFGWDGERPAEMGELLEFRLRAEILSPADIASPEPGDRRYAGAFSLGLHSHYLMDRTEVSLGGELTFTGPQSGVGRFQQAAHELLGMPEPNALDDQIGNGVHPTVLLEMGRPLRFSPTLTVRPFVEGQAGAETFVRIGGDMILGSVAQTDLLIRDVPTGHLYRGTQAWDEGFSFVLGGDVAQVASSVYLPSDEGYELTGSRQRVRAGLHWQGVGGGSVFYGLTWLSEEFEAQPEGQTVGSLRLDFEF